MGPLLGRTRLICNRSWIACAGTSTGSCHGRAVDFALHDWIGKRLGVPAWRWLGLDPAKAPPTSFTIGIDTPN